MSKSASPINTNEIQCPFFMALGDASIVCESPVASARSNVSYFRSRSRMAAHVLWHCSEAEGGGCPIYVAVMRRYEKGDERSGDRGLPIPGRKDKGLCGRERNEAAEGD